MTDNVAIAERLKKFRLSRSLTQRQIAESLGYFPQKYNTIEKGKTGLTAKTRDRLQEVYPELNMDWLIKGEGSMTRTPVQHAKADNGSTIYQSGAGIDIGSNNAELVLARERIKWLESALEEERKARERADKLTAQALQIMAENHRS